jgi:hypothetical protein
MNVALHILMPLLSLIPQPASRVASDQKQLVNLTVTMRNDGKPLAGIPIEIGRMPSPAATETDEQGVARLVASVELGQETIRLNFFSVTRRTGEDHAAFDQRRRQERQRFMGFTFAHPYVVKLEPGKGDYDLAISVTDACIATFRVLQGSQPYDKSTLLVPGVNSLMGTSDERWGGPFLEGHVRRVGCLPKGKAATAYLLCNNHSVVRVPIPPLETSTELPAVDVPAWVADGTVRVNIQGVYRQDPVRQRGAGVTFVSLDGARVYSFDDGDPTEAVVLHNGSLPSLPMGTYYISPGVFRAVPAEVQLIERALAGEDLTERGVPTVSVRKGEETAITIDAAAVDNALFERPQK